jgi:glycine hydroxymethyltransferase
MKDKEVQELIEAENKRQKSILRMIPSECLVSDDVLECLGSAFTQKYSEGYPGKRYYQGQENTDKLERLCIDRAKKAFNLPDDWHVNVQALSGSPANLAAYFALCNPGDIVVGLGLNSGGHLTHGHTVSITGDLFTVHQFDVDPETHLINYNNLEHFVCNAKPKMMIIGTTAYSRILDWKRLREIANKAGCYFVADIAHVAGLVVGGAYPSPIPYADVVTLTTHKTLRGGRGALILCRDEFAKRIDRAVFPYMNGGPHMNNIASIAVALKEATSKEFKAYANQTVKNAKKLASVLSDVYGFNIVSGGTDSHLMVVDLSKRSIDGKTAAIALEKAGIECNYSTIPYDTRPPANPSGIRLGTPILTTIGMKEDDMVTVAAYINKAINNYNNESVLNSIKNEIAKWLHNIESGVDGKQLELPF